MKNQVLTFIFIWACTISFIANAQSEAKAIISPVPDRIMLTIPGDPATSRAVTWRTSPSVNKSIGQITEATASPILGDRLTAIEGTSTFWMKGDSSALGHKVIFDKLSPETMYTYRVGDGDHWSEWFQFTTSSDQNQDFNFLYLGDIQNDIKQHGSRAIRQAYSHFPKADFILYAGDLVSRSSEDYWNEFFYAGNWIFGTMPSVPTPGNHEYDKHGDGKLRTFSKHWNQIFTTPDNHPGNLEGRTYYMDYQGVRFVSVDSVEIAMKEKDGEATFEWLHNVLADNPNQWTILFTHFPVYSCSQGRDKEEYRNAIKPILERYGVDLVLQGHDHTYCRGQNLEGVGEDRENPPMYMTSVAGPKMYGLRVDKWSDRTASETQLYQNIEVTNNKVSVDVFTVTGELYDSFSLIKNEEGVNKVVESELVKNIQENNTIPERAKRRYTEEELKLYMETYSGG